MLSALTGLAAFGASRPKNQADGGGLTYTWDLSWTAANPDRVTTTPTTSFSIQEFNRGTIQLTVTDAVGNTATVTRNFP